ncbi:hypothetical protein FACS189487_00410 [Campylobacterota bacterium]|nr:hypothetical protein FACS189487_00410 [Campylobacterota bacterium]
MPLLQVRDMPADLYETLATVAHTANRSIAQQTIVLLRSALNAKNGRKARRTATLKEIDNLHISCGDNFPDPAMLIREDRGYAFNTCRKSN